MLGAIGGAALGLAAVGWCAPAPAPSIPAVAAVFEIRRRLPGGGIALTFDDGPHPDGHARGSGPPRLGDVRATFFLAGEQVERYPPDVAAEVAARGHLVALHCHPAPASSCG